MSPASTRGRGGGLGETTDASSGNKCGGEGWVLTGGVASLSWRFLGGLVSALAISGILSSLVWEKSTVGRAIASILSSATSCIYSSFLIRPARYGMMAGLKGEFLADST